MHPKYPIVPQRSSNRLNHRTDDKTWKVTQKSATIWGHQFSTVQFVIVNAAYAKTLLAFLKENAGKTVLYMHTGYNPFMNSLNETQAIIKSYSAPQRIKPNTYNISITFLCDQNLKA